MDEEEEEEEEEEEKGRREKKLQTSAKQNLHFFHYYCTNVRISRLYENPVVEKMPSIGIPSPRIKSIR